MRAQQNGFGAAGTKQKAVKLFPSYHQHLFYFLFWRIEVRWSLGVLGQARAVPCCPARAITKMWCLQQSAP